MHHLLERKVFLSIAHVDRAVEEFEDDLAVLDVLRKRGDPQLVVFVEECREVLVVFLIVLDLFRLFDNVVPSVDSWLSAHFFLRPTRCLTSTRTSLTVC